MARNPVTPRRHWRAGPEKTSPAKPLQVLLIAMVGLAVVGIAAASVTRSDTPPSASLPLVIPTVGGSTAPGGRGAGEAAAPAAATTPFIEAAAAGSVAYGAGDFPAALTHYREAIDKNPNDAESHSNLGQVLVRMNQAEEALPHFDRAIALNPGRWAYHFNRARALAVLQRWEEAVAGYRQAQQIYPDDYAIAFNLGQALQRKG